MSAVLSRSFVVLASLCLLACSMQGLVVTLTPTPGKDIIEPTMTTLPTVVYPTLTPPASSTPPVISDMVCEDSPVSIVCKATVCVVRKDPHSGQESVAYTVPHDTVLQGAVVCVCPTCAPIEKSWFYLGKSGGDEFWAINMNQVWELSNGE